MTQWTRSHDSTTWRCDLLLSAAVGVRVFALGRALGDPHAVAARRSGTPEMPALHSRTKEPETPLGAVLFSPGRVGRTDITRWQNRPHGMRQAYSPRRGELYFTLTDDIGGPSWSTLGTFPPGEVGSDAGKELGPHQKAYGGEEGWVGGEIGR
jgi:hypothetical protein